MQTLKQEIGSENVPMLETEANQRLRNVIESLRGEKGGAYQQVKVLFAGAAQTAQVIKDMLVEDCKNPKKEFAYLSFLTHLHRLIIEKSQSI